MLNPRAPTLSQTINQREASTWEITNPTMPQAQGGERKEAHIGSIDFGKASKAKASIVLLRRTASVTEEEKEQDRTTLSTFTKGKPIMNILEFVKACYTSFNGRAPADWLDRVVAIPAKQFGVPWAAFHKLCDNTMLLAFMLEKPECYSTAKGLTERFGAFFVLLDKELSTASVGHDQFFKVAGNELRQALHNSRITIPYHQGKPYSSFHVAHDEGREAEWTESQADAIVASFAAKQPEDYARSLTRARTRGAEEVTDEAGADDAGSEQGEPVIQAVPVSSPPKQVIMATLASSRASSQHAGAQGEEGRASPSHSEAEQDKVSTTEARTEGGEGKQPHEDAAAMKYMEELSENSYNFDFHVPMLSESDGIATDEQVRAELEAGPEGNQAETIAEMADSLFNSMGTPPNSGPAPRGDMKVTKPHLKVKRYTSTRAAATELGENDLEARTRLVRQPTKRPGKGEGHSRRQRRGHKHAMTKPEATIAKRNKARDKAKKHPRHEPFDDTPTWSQELHDEIANADMSCLPAPQAMTPPASPEWSPAEEMRGTPPLSPTYDSEEGDSPSPPTPPPPSTKRVKLDGGYAQQGECIDLAARGRNTPPADPAAQHDSPPAPASSQGSGYVTFSATQSDGSSGLGEFDPETECEDVNMGRDPYAGANVFYSQHQLGVDKVNELHKEWAKTKELRVEEGRTAPADRQADSKHDMRFIGLETYSPIYTKNVNKGSTGLALVRSEHYNQTHITFCSTDTRDVKKDIIINAINATVPYTVKKEDSLYTLEYVKLVTEEGDYDAGIIVFPTGITMGQKIRSTKHLQKLFKTHIDGVTALRHLGEDKAGPVKIYMEHDDQRLLLRIAVLPAADWRYGHHPILTGYGKKAQVNHVQNKHFTVEARAVFANALMNTDTMTNLYKLKCIMTAFSYYGFENADNVVKYLGHWTEQEIEIMLSQTPLLKALSGKDCHALAAQIWRWGQVRHVSGYPFTQAPEYEPTPYAGMQEASPYSDNDSEGMSEAVSDGYIAREQEGSAAPQPPTPPPPPPAPPQPSGQGSTDRARSATTQASKRVTWGARQEEDKNRERARKGQQERRTKGEGQRWHQLEGGMVNDLHDSIAKSPSVDKQAVRQAHGVMQQLCDDHGLSVMKALLNITRQQMNNTYRLADSMTAGGASGAGKTTLVGVLPHFLHDEMALEEGDVQAQLEHWEVFASELEDYKADKGRRTEPPTLLMALQMAILRAWNRPSVTPGIITIMDRCPWDALPYILQGLLRGDINMTQTIELFDKFRQMTCLPQVHVFLDCDRNTALHRLMLRTQAGDAGFSYDGLGEIRAFHLVWEAILRLWAGSERVITVLNEGTIYDAATATVGVIRRAATTLREMQGVRGTAARRMNQRALGAGAADPGTEADGGAQEEGEDRMVRFNVSLTNFVRVNETYKAQFDVDIASHDIPGTIVGKICARIMLDTGTTADNAVSSYACFAERGDMVGHEVPINNALEPREVNSYTIITRLQDAQGMINSEQLKALLGMLQRNQAATDDLATPPSHVRGLRLRRDGPSAFGSNVPLGASGVPSAAAQNSLFNNTDPKFSGENRGGDGDVSSLPLDMLEDPAASRHCTLAGTPLHPSCPRPIKDIPENSVVYVEYFGEQTTEIEDLLNEAEDFTVGANGALVQQGKKLKPLKSLGEYMEAADSMDLWMTSTGRHTQQESMLHRCFTRGIRELCEMYTWEAVIRYDHTFRALKAAGEINTWSEHRPELVCKVLLPGLKSARPRQQQSRPAKRKARASGQNATNEPARKKAKSGGGGGNKKKKKQPCRRFNSTAGCPMTPGDGQGECWYEHQCSVQGCNSRAHGASGHK